MTDVKPLKAVITAGGIGARLLPFSKEIPKEMAPILVKGENGSIQVKPMVQAIFEQLYEWGVRDYLIVVGRGKGAIQNHFTADSGFVERLKSRGTNLNGLEEFYMKLRSSNIVFIPQPEALGFGDAVLRARPHISSDFVVHAGDTYIISNGNAHLDRLRVAHRANSASATLLVQKVKDPTQYGVVVGKEQEGGVIAVTRAVEKPEKFVSDIAIMPVYMFDTRIFDAIASFKVKVGSELQLTSGIQRLRSEGRKVIGVKLRKEELRLEIGSPETLLEALKLSSQHLGF